MSVHTYTVCAINILCYSCSKYLNSSVTLPEYVSKLLDDLASVKNQNRKANSVDPDEMAHYDQSHPYLNCLQKYCYALQGLQG